MPPELDARLNTGYAAFGLRFRALLLDAGICMGFFLIAGLATGVVLEQRPMARATGFVLIVGTILCYEPFMVANTGGHSDTAC